jgi:serine/threonine protein kinase
MGEVYLADDSVNGTKVAVKIIDVPKAEYEDLLMRELDASRVLSGKNVVSTIHTGKALFGAQNFLYLVQEYYPKGNLRKKIAPKLDLDICLRMMNDLLDGLATVHTRIVHRDLKPENILISNDESLLIADFGLSKYIEEATKTNTFKGGGTYPYMAPECWTYQPNTVAMDIYSLGIIFFEILAGQLPAKFATVDAWRDFHLFAQLPDLSTLRPDVPVKLKQIIMKMTQKRVGDRFPDAKSIKESLKQAAIQANAERSEIERLAQIAHSTIQQISAEKLRLKEQAEKDANNQKLMNYHISELFDMMKKLVAEINEKLGVCRT